LLARHLPEEKKQSATRYPQLLRSTLTLFFEEPVLRERAVFSLLIFAILNVLWAPLVLPLTAPPQSGRSITAKRRWGLILPNRF